MKIRLVLAHPDLSFHAGVADSVISRTLRRWPAVGLHGYDEGCGMDGPLPLRERLFVLGMQVLDPVLCFMVVI